MSHWLSHQGVHWAVDGCRRLSRAVGGLRRGAEGWQVSGLYRELHRIVEPW